jgi:hypothetical protein
LVASAHGVVQVSGYCALKYVYYRIPFSWANWVVLFPLAAFSTAVVTYHNVDEQRLVLNATHFDYTFVTDFIQLVSAAVLHVPGVYPPAHSPHFDVRPGALWWMCLSLKR